MGRRRRLGPAPPGTGAAPSPRGPRRSARTAASLSPWLDASADQAELGQRGDPVIEADLLADQAVLDLEDGDAAEAHPPCCPRQTCVVLPRCVRGALVFAHPHQADAGPDANVRSSARRSRKRGRPLLAGGDALPYRYARVAVPVAPCVHSKPALARAPAGSHRT